MEEKEIKNEESREERLPTAKQLTSFNVMLSFIVSIIGTVLAMAVFGPLLGMGEELSGPLQINRPGVLERIKETVVQGKTEVLRQDELVVQVVEEMSPAVVSIVASKDVPVIERYYVDPFQNDPLFQQFFGGDSGFQVPQYRQKGTQTQEISAGTGFFVSENGLVMTNKHVVADASADYTVLMNDGRKLPARVLARDPIQDLAILKVEGDRFIALRLGDSGKTKIGQSVIAIGNALGEFRNTVSVGVVSGLHRSITAASREGAEQLQELIQTDAAINPGNSGGPLLNLRGDVIGISTAVAQGAENIGFAIPIDSAKRALQSVQELGKITYPFLGVSYAGVTKELASREKLGRDYGAYVVASDRSPAVVSGSPAEKAGIKEKDIILSINGQNIDTEHTLSSLIQKYKIGEEITVRLFRGSEEMEVKVKLEERK